MDLLEYKAENSRRLRQDWRDKREVFRSLPEIVNLNHSNACNLRCVTCWHHTGVPIHAVKLRDVERICHQLFPAARKVVLTAAGEPLINDFDEIVALAAHYQVKIDMFTSCFNMTEERFRASRALFDLLHVSMDCPDKDGYERIRVRSSYERVVDNLRMMKAILDAEGKSFVYHCQAAILKSTVRFLPAFVGFVRELGFDLLHVQRVFKTHAGLEGEDILTAMPRAELDAIVAETAAEARRLNQTVILHEIGYPNVIADPPPRPEDPPLLQFRHDGVCWFVGQSIGVNHGGEVFPCCYPTDIYLGDALREPMRRIWNGPAMRRLRRQFHTGKLNVFCQNCFLVNENPVEPRNFDFYRRQARMRWFEVKKRMAKRFQAVRRA
ncbi:MAG: radical SAM protein [Planctomycetes bacterium]|nr:radical SAM protein [Planctomycetota bacterium]